MKNKIVIIGGVAGGATAAARLRRLDENAEIVLFEKGSDISYANCGLPYYLGRNIKERERLLLQTPESFYKRFHISVKVAHEVTAIHRNRKTVMVKNLRTLDCFEAPYDKLLISTGASGRWPDFVGETENGIFGLRTLQDMDQMDTFITERKPQNVVVIGAGFIGLEVAENLKERGLDVTIIQNGDQVLGTVDYTIASQLHLELKHLQINVLLSESVVGLSMSKDHFELHLLSGKMLQTDMVVVSTGIVPNAALAADAGLELGSQKGIAVNEYMQTSDPDIYAVGDVAEIEHLVLHKKMLIPLAGPANKQARIAADNIVLGNTKQYKGAVGTAIIKVGGLTAASAGLTENVLKRNGMAYETVTIHAQSHAGYYPGSRPMTLKLNFSKENGQLFGAQVIGSAGVSDRINVLSLVLQKNGTVADLMDFEQAYAPPYSSAKDPVNMLGFVAENVWTGKVTLIHAPELMETLHDSDRTLVDVRTNEEYEMGHLEGSIHIPLDELRSQLVRLDQHKEIVVYCQVGLRGYNAARILTQHGFTQVRNLDGGYKTYNTLAKAQQIDVAALPHIEKEPLSPTTIKQVIQIDACGLQCPGPIMALKKAYEKLEPQQQLAITVTDSGFLEDVQGWSRMTGAMIVDQQQNKGVYEVTLQKNDQLPVQIPTESKVDVVKDNKTIIVFSNDFDKVFASLIIANGAIAAGKKVSLFFTFWGLSVLRKKGVSASGKSLMDRMFAKMLPNSIENLSLSKMNMGGTTPSIMKRLMRKKNIASLQVLLQNLIQNGTELIACSMSMEVMGIKREELLDEVKIGGVAAYLDRAESANLNLFI